MVSKCLPSHQAKGMFSPNIGPLTHVLRSLTHEIILLYFATLQPILQPRTAFGYKTPEQERVYGNATSIPRLSEKRHDTKEVPTKRG